MFDPPTQNSLSTNQKQPFVAPFHHGQPFFSLKLLTTVPSTYSSALLYSSFLSVEFPPVAGTEKNGRVISTVVQYCIHTALLL